MKHRSLVTPRCNKGESANMRDDWRRRERTQRSEGDADASFGR